MPVMPLERRCAAIRSPFDKDLTVRGVSRPRPHDGRSGTDAVKVSSTDMVVDADPA